MKHLTLLFFGLLTVPALAMAGERPPGVVAASTSAQPAERVKHAMHDMLRHYYSVKVTMQYCAARFDDMQMDLKASHSRWVERHSQIVSEARQVILKNRFSPSPHALDNYLMAQVKPALLAIQGDDSTEQKVHCFDTMVGIEEGVMDIVNKYQKEYELLQSL